LARTVDRLQLQLQQRSGHSRELDQQVDSLVSRRSQALLDLAKHYLPDISVENVQRTFAGVRSDLLELIQRKQQREEALHRELEQRSAELDATEQRLHTVTDQLNQKVAEREQLEQRLAERLHASPSFVQLSQQAVAAESELEQNERRVEESRSEAERKLPSYEASRLFRYLYDCRYGTTAYRGRGLTRSMDRWVAKLIDFTRARQGYEFLKTTPGLMAQEVLRRREQFDTLMAQVEAIEDQLSDEIGLTAVMQAGEQLGQQRDRIIEQMAQQQLLLEERRQELLELERPDNAYYSQALSRMQEYLASLKQTQLQQKSWATPEPHDDMLVREIGQLTEQLQSTERQLTEANQQHLAWDRQLAAVQQLLQRFRQAEFDSQRSSFSPSLGIDRLVQELVEGRIEAEQVWNQLRQAQRFAPTWQQGSSSPLQEIAGGEISGVLFQVLSEVAGQAMRQTAQRGMQRRGPTRTVERRSQGRPPFRQRGFTNGRGF
jgi:DNA repair exonuclease SbcCD ATPase subunit